MLGLAKICLILKCILVVAMFLWTGRWFADFYVAKSGRTDRWRRVFLATSLPVILIEVAVTARLLWIL